MARNVFLNIDDDVSKATVRLKKEKSADVVLVLPKGSLLLANPANLKALKKQADLLAKKVAIMTRDEKGRLYAREAGFGIQELDYLNRKTAGMNDVAPKTRRKQIPVQPKSDSSETVEAEVEPLLEAGPATTLAGGFGLAEPPVEEDAAAPAQGSAPTAPGAPAGESWPRIEMRPAAAEELQRIFEQPGVPAPAGREPKPLLLDPKVQAKSRPRRFLRNSVFVAVILFILIVVFVLPSAEITVFARTQPIVRDFQIAIDKNLTAANSDQLAVPGKLIGDAQDFSVQFDSTGQLNVGTAARGTVQIYNFTGRILKLGAATTTLTIGTKTFHFTNDAASIKPTRYFPGTKNPDPASLGPEVQIVADQPGEDSDFPAGNRAEIHNQVLGTIPQLLYAKVVTPVDNGTSRFRSVVTQQDLDNARKAFSQKFLDMERQKYAAQNLAILDSGANLQLQSLSFDQKAGDQAQKFTAVGHGAFSALAFDPDQVRNLVEQRIDVTLDSGKYLVTGTGSEKISEDFKNIDLNAGSGVLNLHFQSLVAASIDTAGIAAKVNGKTALQLKEMLLSDPNIDAVDIRFSPFWVQSVPSFSGRIKVNSKLNQSE